MPTDLLTRDALNLMDACGARSFHLVGHDWGGQLAWLIAAANPERIASLTVLSRPHPAAFTRALAEDPEQAKRSRHHQGFREPDAVARLRQDNFKSLRKGLEHEGIAAADVDVHLRTLAEDGALEGAINWYRANTIASAIAPVSMPTLYIWGTADASVGRRAAELTSQFVRGSYQFVEIDGGVLITKYENRKAIPARWGLVNSWAKDNKRAAMCINAKAETVDTLPSFRGAFQQRRCIVPADGFYEWRGPESKREPLWFHPRSGELLLMAGLYEAWQHEPRIWETTFTIITTTANAMMEPIHNRMPVLLDEGGAADWMNPREPDPKSLKRLLAPAPGAPNLTAANLARMILRHAEAGGAPLTKAEGCFSHGRSGIERGGTRVCDDRV